MFPASIFIARTRTWYFWFWPGGNWLEYSELHTMIFTGVIGRGLTVNLRAANSREASVERASKLTNTLQGCGFYWFFFFFPPETQIQPVETVEVVTTEMPEEDKPSSPLAQSPPAENSAGPSVPASREVKSRLETLNCNYLRNEEPSFFKS